MILSVRLRGDNAVCVSAEQLLKICTCIASGAASMSWAWPALRVVVQASYIVAGQRNSLSASVTHSQTKAMFVRSMKIHIHVS